MDRPATTGSMNDPGPENFSEHLFTGHSSELNENDILVPANFNPRLPNGIIVAVLMLVGIVGNSLVLYVYGFKVQRTVFSLFVTVLALLDLTTSLCGMPIDVVIKVFLLPDSDAMKVICKIAHFENYGTSLTSGSVLLLIAVTRHRKVCQPLEQSLSRRSARVTCAIIFTAAMIICSVTLVINGPETVKIAIGHTEVAIPSIKGTTENSTMLVPENLPQNMNDSISKVNETKTVSKRQVVEINICRTNAEYKGTELYFVLYSILSLAFVTILLSLIILHCRISHSVKQFQRRQSRMRSPSIFSNGSNSTDINSKMFRIFACVTLVFIASYLPHLICTIVEQSLFSRDQPLPQHVRIIMDFAYNSPYINVIANPFIYGYMSALFREHCIILFYRVCCWCCWYRKYR